MLIEESSHDHWPAIRDHFLVQTYSEWSEEVYAAGWMSYSPQYGRDFKEWLRQRLFPEYPPEPIDYEAEALPDLRQVLAELLQEQTAGSPPRYDIPHGP